jgi:acetylglutamate kinase
LSIQELVYKAEVLIEALPYIRRFYEKVFVIKYGGHAMVDETLKAEFARDVVLLKYIGINVVIVHGGGPQIGDVLKRMGKESTFVEGMRFTDPETMEIVEMVLVGRVNKEIVANINQVGGRAVGLSGKDGQLIKARRMELKRIKAEDQPPEIINLGLVGEVEEVNSSIISTLDNGNYIPVIAPVGVSREGETLNINADLVAGRIAEALSAEKLILLTDVEAIQDVDGRLIPGLTRDECREKIKDGVISGGMIPKVNCCISALNNGVKKAHIIDGRVRHSLLLEVFTDSGVGTQIT